MATQEERIAALVTRMATQSKSLRMLINGNLVDLSALHTTAKGSLLAAINEIADDLDALSGSAAGINDGAVATTSTWSSSKTQSSITAAIDALKGGAGPLFDTLKELQDLVVAAEESGDISALATTVGLKANASDVYSKAEMGAIDRDWVALFESGL